MCEWIQCGRSVKADWSQRLARKGRKKGGREEGREVAKELMNGRYNMVGKMRGRNNLMRGSQGLGSISNGFYTAPALLQGGVGDDIIPMAFMSNYYTIKAEWRDPSTVSTNGIDSQT